jgi:hypothetical protein
LAPRSRFLLRWILLALLVLLPMRMAWSAAAGYCAHEPAAGAAHFGHHAHGHGDKAGGDDTQGAGLSDPDCSACHAWVGHMPALPAAATPVPPGGFVGQGPAVAHPSLLLPDIERPKWRGLA